MSSSSIITEREQTHGAFAAVAETAQELKLIFRRTPNWLALSDVQREALESKATKLARLLCGDPNEIDHWRDDAGYSELVVRNLRRASTTFEAIERELRPPLPRTAPLSEMLRRVEEDEAS
jgi:hypothetical protein